MPTTYAHDRFGREVYEQLPANLKKIIRENKKLYLIGLHGPDIFFYYHPFSKNRVSDYGTLLHEQTASVLFEDEVKKYQQSPSEAMEAYLLGFACHYLLDSTCHPYIGKFVDHTGISHAKIETSLDQYFMLEDGLDRSYTVRHRRSARTPTATRSSTAVFRKSGKQKLSNA